VAKMLGDAAMHARQEFAPQLTGFSQAGSIPAFGDTAAHEISIHSGAMNTSVVALPAMVADGLLLRSAAATACFAPSAKRPRRHLGVLGLALALSHIHGMAALPAGYQGKPFEDSAREVSACPAPDLFPRRSAFPICCSPRKASTLISTIRCHRLSP
jgi:hypothetical protein